MEATELLETVHREYVDGVSEELFSRTQEVSTAFHEARRKCMQMKLILEEVEAILQHHRILETSEKRKVEEIQLYRSFDDAFSRAQAMDCKLVSTNFIAGNFPFGAKVSKVASDLKEEIQKILVPELEKRLEHKVAHLLHFYRRENDNLNPKDLAILVDQNTKRLAHARTSVLQNETELMGSDLQGQYSEYLKKAVEQLAVVLKKYKLKHQQEYDEADFKWLEAKSRATSRKLRLVILKICCNTYVPGKVAALQEIKRHLETAINAKMEDNSRLEQKLKLYKSIGNGYDQIVEEYASVVTALKEKRWLLQKYAK
eukprot:m.341316 g.341316  ORF g.341316 m.341316 type:complete len:314 (+) comp20005_c0_seq1:130-1071(+)